MKRNADTRLSKSLGAVYSSAPHTGDQSDFRYISAP